MEIKESMEELESVNLNPINIEEISESKKLLGMTPKFKTMYLRFEKGMEVTGRSHEGYASLFVYKGKINIEYETGEKFTVVKGSYLAVDARVKHSVSVEEPSEVVVTICFPD